jgi:integrase-like protein
VAQAQAAIDEYRHRYNTDRPHQSLDMAFPVDRFRPEPDDGIALKLPPSLAAVVEEIAPPAPRPARLEAGPAVSTTSVGLEVERTINATGLLALAGRQHSVGFHLAGRRVTALAEVIRTTSKRVARFKARKPEPLRQRPST